MYITRCGSLEIRILAPGCRLYLGQFDLDAQLTGARLGEAVAAQLAAWVRATAVEIGVERRLKRCVCV